MGAIVMRNIIFILMSFIFVSCSVLQNGFDDHNGQYVPKRPHYKLKDKQGVFPVMLDTTSVYKMVEMYDDGVLIYPLSNANDGLNSIYNYIKFYKNGRCLRFSIQKFDEKGNPIELVEKDLNPNNQYYTKDYYHSSNGTNIQIERFVYGDGTGHYVISDHTLNTSGDTLIRQDKYIKIIYKKETIPLSWNRYKIDW